VGPEVGKRKEDQRSHTRRRWQTDLRRIYGGDGTAMADLWKAHLICGGGGTTKAEQQNGAVMAALNVDGRGAVEKKERKEKNKRKTRRKGKRNMEETKKGRGERKRQSLSLLFEKAT
jgi:hypothetical protein